MLFLETMEVAPVSYNHNLPWDMMFMEEIWTASIQSKKVVRLDLLVVGVEIRSSVK